MPIGKKARLLGVCGVAVLAMAAQGCVPADQARRPNVVGPIYRPAAPPDKNHALIYVYMGTDMSSASQGVYIGNRYIGVLRAHKAMIGGDYYCEYAYAYIPPASLIEIAAINPGVSRQGLTNNAPGGQAFYYEIEETSDGGLNSFVRLRQRYDDRGIQRCNLYVERQGVIRR